MYVATAQAMPQGSHMNQRDPLRLLGEVMAVLSSSLSPPVTKYVSLPSKNFKSIHARPTQAYGDLLMRAEPLREYGDLLILTGEKTCSIRSH